ncbi:MAG: PorT family protein [Bacteroidales bacterium]|nr:PorT family protein [Bacteroidales bacterium]
MKKIILILAGLILIIIYNANAQKGKELTFGIGGALTSVWIMNQNFYGEPEVQYAPKMGYATSFNIGYNFTENITVATEFQYSAQGQKYDDKQNIGGIKYEVNRNIDLRYLNIPLFFKYAFGDKQTKFRFLVGPQLGILLDATQIYKRDGDIIGTTAIDEEGNTFITDAKNIKDRFEKNDIGIVLDVGADIHLSKEFFISAGGRVNYGFKDINAAAYRIDDIDGEYTPSHNVWGGLYVSIHYKLDVEGYSPRSF